MAELGVIIALNLAILAYLRLSIGGAKAHLEESLELLSQQLAEAVLKVSQSTAISGVEQPNPFQMMLMQLIQGRIQQQSRNPDGTFTVSSVDEDLPLL